MWFTLMDSFITLRSVTETVFSGNYDLIMSTVG